MHPSRLQTHFALLLTGLLFATGCSTFERWQAGAQEHRQFDVQRVWVRATLQQETLRFRKMNRFSPVFVPREGKPELLIQANAMDGMTAYEKDSGRLVWRLPIRNGVESTAAVVGTKLFFGASDGLFYSVDALTGTVLWTYPVRMEVLSEPLVADGVVYFLSGANTVYALAVDSGKQLWLYNRQDPSQLSVRGGSRPSIRGNTLYVGFSDGTLVALVNTTGAVKWEKKLNKNKKFRDMDSTPLIDGEVLYILGYDDSVYALRSATGDLVWRAPIGGYGEILRAGDKLFFGSTSEEFVALNAESGKKLWSIPTPDGIATGASLIKGLVVFGDSLGKLHFVEPGSGRKVGSFAPGSGIHAAPRADEARSTVYFITNEANLYALKIGWKMASEIPFLH